MLTTERARTITRVTLLSAVTAGAMLFGSLFVATVTAPRQIERVAQAFLRAEVEESVRARFGDRTDSALTRIQRIGALGAALAARADSLRRPAASDGLEILPSSVVGAYQARLQALIRELRFFAAVNAALFGLIALLLYARRSDMRPVLLPSALLLVSTLGAATIYVTTQDWFWTILLGDYMGAWYLALVGVTTAFAADVVFLKGRVSLEILGNVPAVLIPPC